MLKFLALPVLVFALCLNAGACEKDSCCKERKTPLRTLLSKLHCEKQEKVCEPVVVCCEEPEPVVVCCKEPEPVVVCCKVRKTPLKNLLSKLHCDKNVVCCE